MQSRTCSQESLAHLKNRLVRDQANKTFDLYLQRARKYGNSLPDSALPQATINGNVSRMGNSQSVNSQNDTSWSGWAISSFTNKLAAVSGEMQSKPVTAQPPAQPSDGRPSSVSPGPTDVSRPAYTEPYVASTLHRQALTGASSTPTVLVRTSTERFFEDVQGEDDEIDDAWGDMGEESFFDASSEPKLAPLPSQPVTFDDGGEPDFEGWLKAQAQAKSKPPLPKGLAKSSAKDKFDSTTTSATAGSGATGKIPGSGVGVKKLPTMTSAKSKVVTPTSLSTKLKEGAANDDWGDAWD